MQHSRPPVGAGPRVPLRSANRGAPEAAPCVLSGFHRRSGRVTAVDLGEAARASAFRRADHLVRSVTPAASTPWSVSPFGWVAWRSTISVALLDLPSRSADGARGWPSTPMLRVSLDRVCGIRYNLLVSDRVRRGFHDYRSVSSAACGFA